MSANSFGQIFKWSSFGESHGPAMGVVIEGCPAGLTLDLNLLNQNLQRRRPGQVDSSGQVLVSERNEGDVPIIMSGIFKGRTLGTPIAIRIDNHDQRSADYGELATTSRIGHADDTWRAKFSQVDYRGGGRASARETVARVIAGSFAQMLCCQLVPTAQVTAHIASIGEWSNDAKGDELLSAENKSRIAQAKEAGDSLGGTIVLMASGFGAGLGQPVFKKLKSELAAAMMSINACVGVELGEGFLAARQRGTELHRQEANPSYGGIRGGLSTGEPISLRLAFKPTASILAVAQKGRHDPCILPRAVPVVEAMAWAVFADHLLWQRLDNIE